MSGLSPRQRPADINFTTATDRPVRPAAAAAVLPIELEGRERQTERNWLSECRWHSAAAAVCVASPSWAAASAFNTVYTSKHGRGRTDGRRWCPRALLSVDSALGPLSPMLHPVVATAAVHDYAARRAYTEKKRGVFVVGGSGNTGHWERGSGIRIRKCPSFP